MAKEIKMPQLSDTMDSGKIISWFKSVGDVIERGDILAEVETDKANLEIESFDSGTLLSIAVEADGTADVGSVIAVLGEPGESVSESAKPAAAAQPVQEAPPAQENEPAQQAAAEPSRETSVEIPEHTQRRDSQTADISHETGGDDQIKASPLAKKLAREQNINLNTINGSGPNGRIIRKDVDENQSAGHFSGQSLVSSQDSTAKRDKVQNNAALTPSKLGGQKTELSKMRATIARRMQESMQDSPHFYMTSVVNMKSAKELREALKVKDEFKGLSLNHMIIKACANALAKVPEVNAALADGKLYEPDQINIGVITALENGLLIPVIHQADQLSLMQVAHDTREKIGRARGGKPSATDLTGGTFSISNMGMFDVENFTAIINPGQGGILAVSAMKEKPVVEAGKLAVGLEMKVTVSVDHRIIDGIAAAQFLKTFKEQLELPALLLV